MPLQLHLAMMEMFVWRTQPTPTTMGLTCMEAELKFVTIKCFTQCVITDGLTRMLQLYAATLGITITTTVSYLTF